MDKKAHEVYTEEETQALFREVQALRADLTDRHLSWQGLVRYGLTVLGWWAIASTTITAVVVALAVYLA